jgi:hypothetical protein
MVEDSAERTWIRFCWLCSAGCFWPVWGADFLPPGCLSSQHAKEKIGFCGFVGAGILGSRSLVCGFVWVSLV